MLLLVDVAQHYDVANFLSVLMYDLLEPRYSLFSKLVMQALTLPNSILTDPVSYDVVEQLLQQELHLGPHVSKMTSKLLDLYLAHVVEGGEGSDEAGTHSVWLCVRELSGLTPQ